MKRIILTIALITFYITDIRAETTDENFSVGYIDPINVEGEFNRRQQNKSAYSKSLDSKLDKQNQKRNKMIKNKIERKQMELGNIITDKLNQALQGKISMGEDSDSVQEEEKFVAPKRQKIQPEAILSFEKAPNFDDSPKGVDQVDIIPYMGALNITGGNVDLDSRLSFGMAIESELNTKTRLGLDFNYSELDIEPLDQNNMTLYQRDINFRRLGLDLAARVSLFDIDSSKINPFMGVSVGYSNTSMEYSYLTHVTPFVSNAFVASAMVGADIAFNKQVGINLAVKFSRGLTDDSDITNSNDDDVNRLNSIGRSIEDANYTSFNGGLVLKF